MSSVTIICEVSAKIEIEYQKKRKKKSKCKYMVSFIPNEADIRKKEKKGNFVPEHDRWGS